MKSDKKSKKILLVDDDELNTAAFAQRLSKRGFSTEVVTSGKEALERLDTGSFDLVLLDIVMEDIDGLAVLKKIRARFNPEELPIIMVTIVDNSMDVLNAFEFGANDYISKPLNIDVAIARIRGQLSSVDLRLERQKQIAVEAIAALAITCHHEINNSLAIAKGRLQIMAKAQEKVSDQSLEGVYAAFERIRKTLEDLKDIAEQNEVSFQNYSPSSKMIKLK